jgi:hypothetical protein
VRLFLSAIEEGRPIRDLAAVDWAFAGTSKHDETAVPPRTSFTHWIDSRHVDAAAFHDEGDMFPGAEKNETLKRGHMINPNSGVDEAYEECWVDGIPANLLGNVNSSGYVLKYEDGDDKGLIVCIGEHAQGVLREGGEVGVFRWEYIGGIVVEIGRHEAFPLNGPRYPFEGDKFAAPNGWNWVCVERW